MKYNFRKLLVKEAIICTLTILWVLLVSLGLTYGCFMVTMANHSFIRYGGICVGLVVFAVIMLKTFVCIFCAEDAGKEV